MTNQAPIKAHQRQATVGLSASRAADGSGASRTRRKVVIEGEDREFVSDVEYRIEKMRQATSSETSLLLDPCSALRRRLVYQEFSANDLAISKVPHEEGEELAQRKKPLLKRKLDDTFSRYGPGDNPGPSDHDKTDDNGAAV